MADKANGLTIGDLAKATNIHVETIRYYQRRGLVREPERPPGGIRRYGSADIERLTFVKTAQHLGFSLDEVSDLLQLEDGAHCREASALAEHKLQDVRGKIDRLQRIEKVLSEMVSRCHAQHLPVDCLIAWRAQRSRRPKGVTQPVHRKQRGQRVAIIYGRRRQGKFA